MTIVEIKIMVLFMVRTDIEKKVGRRLNDLRIIRKFDQIDDFGKTFNDGKKHKDFSSYLKGKNLRFDTLVKFATILKIGLPTIFDFDKIYTVDQFYQNLAFDKSIQFWLNIFRKNITLYRKDKFKTQLDFEQKIGITRENLSNYENGKTKPTLITIQRFAVALEIEPIYLFLKA